MRGHAGLADFEPHDVVEGRERRRPAPPGRRARLSREGVDEIAADWVFTNGRILTLDRARPTAGALAVAGRADRGRRATARDVRGWRDRRTRVIDLARRHRHPRPRRRARPPRSRGAEAASTPRWPAAARSPTSRCWCAGSRPRRQPGEWIVTMPRRRAAVLPRRAGVPGRAPLADARRPRRRRARPSRLHPRHLGLLEQAARLLGRQQRGAARGPASRATRCRPTAWRSPKDAAGEPTGVFVEHNLIQVLEFTLMRTRRASPTPSACARSASRSAATPRAASPRLRGARHRAGGAGASTARRTSAARSTCAATLAVSPTWDGPVEAATAPCPSVASWAGGRGLGDDRLRVAGICLHYGGDPEVARHPARGASPTPGGPASWRAPTPTRLRAAGDAGRAAWACASTRS